MGPCLGPKDYRPSIMCIAYFRPSSISYTICKPLSFYSLRSQRGFGQNSSEYNLQMNPNHEKLSEGRILGLDVGSRRIGIAVSDPLGITAQGLETLQRRNKRQDLAALEQIIREYAVREIVVGLPLRMSGAEGTQSDKMQVFAEDLRKKFRLPVHLWDERLTSAEANRLLRQMDLSIDKRAKAVDRMAAVLILQGWMETNRRQASGSWLTDRELP